MENFQKKVNEILGLSDKGGGWKLRSLLGIELLYLDQKFNVRRMTRGIPEITSLGEGDLELNISHTGIVEGYPEWEDDVKKARRGKRVYREIQNRKMRLLVEILPYGLSTEIKGYVVLIQKMG